MQVKAGCVCACVCALVRALLLACVCACVMCACACECLCMFFFGGGRVGWVSCHLYAPIGSAHVLAIPSSFA